MMVQTLALNSGNGLDYGGPSAGGYPLTWWQLVSQSRKFVILDSYSTHLKADVDNALQAGIAVALFQGYWPQAWSDAAEATTRANDALSAAKSVNYPKNAVIWLDCEEMNITAIQAIDWINAWSKIVHDAGYEAGVYIGDNCPLNGTQWYEDLPWVTHYWKSPSQAIPEVAVRGYQLIQESLSQDLNGHSVDFDIATTDQKGGTPVFMVLSEPNAVSQPVAAPTAASEPLRIYSVVVQSGQTLESLCQNYGARAQDVIQFNQLTSNNIYPGQILKLPVF